MLDSIQAEPGLNPVRHYTERLRRVLTELPDQVAGCRSSSVGGFGRTYDGLQNILADLAFCKRSINIAQFEQILADAMSGYTLPQPRSFLQQICRRSGSGAGHGLPHTILGSVWPRRISRPAKEIG